MGRPFIIDWQHTAAVLSRAYVKERHHLLKPRLQALWLLRSGWSMEDVARVVVVHYRTVQQWVAWYRKGGLEEVRQHLVGGHGRAGG